MAMSRGRAQYLLQRHYAPSRVETEIAASGAKRAYVLEPRRFWFARKVLIGRGRTWERVLEDAEVPVPGSRLQTPHAGLDPYVPADLSALGVRFFDCPTSESIEVAAESDGCDFEIVEAEGF